MADPGDLDPKYDTDCGDCPAYETLGWEDHDVGDPPQDPCVTCDGIGKVES